MHEVLVNGLGGLSLPRKSVVRLTDRPDMTLDVYRGCKTTKQNNNLSTLEYSHFQGITVKIDETGDLVIARIMTGSMSDKLGRWITRLRCLETSERSTTHVD